MISYFSVAYNLPSSHLNAARARCTQPHQSWKWSAVSQSQMCTATYNLLILQVKTMETHKQLCSDSASVCQCQSVCCIFLPAVSYPLLQRSYVWFFHAHLTCCPALPSQNYHFYLLNVPWWALSRVKATMCYWSWSRNVQALSKITETMHHRDEWEVRLQQNWGDPNNSCFMQPCPPVRHTNGE